MNREGKIHPASFRDPSGFLFNHNGQLLRQVNQSYQAEYDKLISSGLYQALVDEGLLVAHEEVDLSWAAAPGAYRVIRPEVVPFISYPFEWSFSQLRDAALATLAVQQRAFNFGMSLKDASAYNIQFVDGRPRLIDTLSFEIYQEGKPWVAYRQFCQHFLAPLALMAYRDVEMSKLLRVHIDGVPLALAAGLLPWRTRLRPGLLMHIHLHASAQRRFAGQGERVQRNTRTMSRTAFLGVIDSLQTAVRKLRWQPAGTEWGDYYDDTNYTQKSHQSKADAVTQMLAQTDGEVVWDLGANDGRFSRLASQRGMMTVAFDIDPAAVEHNYLSVKAQSEKKLLPLVMDLTNPSPGIGWQHQERDSLLARGPADVVLALALIHHLAISNNVPLPRLAEFFAAVGRQLIIEFVPKEDSQVQRLLASRQDIFPQYTNSGFEAAFAEKFTTESVVPIAESQRTLYLMRRKD